MRGRSLRVDTSAGGYDVVIAPGTLDEAGGIVRASTAARRAALVCDDTTAGLFADRVTGSLRAAGFEVTRKAVPPGEGSKSWERAGSVLEWLAADRVPRDAIVVALGGGVVGDLAGFCAAVYMRGIPVVQVPTTLLAQVDSAIGGKTAVDLEGGKNLAGAFHSPLAVIADTSCLGSLPGSEWTSGLAEVAKSAILDSEDSVATLESDAKALTGARDPAAVERAVWMAAGLKARVVSGDEREAGERECLNYGHTLGHAIELAAGYGTLTHGAAIAEGMRFAARLAEREISAQPAWSARQDALLTALGLPPIAHPWDAGRLADAMRADKKVRAGEVRFVLSARPGEWCARAVGDATILDVIGEWRAQA